MNQKIQTKLSELTGDTYWSLLKSWPKGRDLLALGGKGSKKKLVAWEFQEVSPAEFLNQEIGSPGIDLPEESFGLGYVACLSYDDFANAEVKDSFVKSKYFKILSAITFSGDDVFLVMENGKQEKLNHIRNEILKIISESLTETYDLDYQWTPHWRKSEYAEAFDSCIEDIRAGRYYQINLLQYYTSNDKIQNWFPRFEKSSGPFGAWIRIPAFELISFSPERFVHWEAEPGHLPKIVAQPIKGTAPVFSCHRKNLESKDFLSNSDKDHAELHMIVDLMRNDLHRICQPHSVIVRDPGSLHSFKYVHHLIADIQGQLLPGSKLNDILDVLCPGGSITGAPKIEVMKAINKYEQRPRGFFMGNICYFNPSTQYFDSSILIRTIYQENSGPYQFAAGSGLTINSKVESEWAEILAKSRILHS